MAENPNVTHPNWVSLATCQIKFKKFVKGTADQEIKANKLKELGVKEEGEAVKRFYDELVNDPKHENDTIDKVVKTEDDIIEISDSECELEVVEDSRSTKQLLEAVQNNNIELLTRTNFCDYNTPDAYGWTPLEIACVLGHIQVVQFLLDKGGRIINVDRVNKILTEKGLTVVKDLLKKGYVIEDDDDIIEFFPVENKEEEICDICGATFYKRNKVEHISSVTHQLSVERTEVSRNPGFGISETNLGFRMLLAGGWDGTRGLSEGQGRLFPVKTVLRHGRTRKGLTEGDKKQARVTHFGPGDTRSVINRKWKKKPKVVRTKKLRRGNKTKSVNVGLEQTIRESLGSM